MSGIETTSKPTTRTRAVAPLRPFLVNQDDGAQYLGITVSALEKLRRSGQVTFYTNATSAGPGRRTILYDPKDLEKLAKTAFTKVEAAL